MLNKKNLVEILVMVLVFGMMVVGCDDGSTNGNGSENGGGKTVTFSINKVNERTFTVTVEGAKWKNISHIHNLLTDSVISAGGGLGATVNAILWNNVFDAVRTSDTVFTYTLRSSWGFASGTISLKSDVKAVDGDYLTDGGSAANYVVNSARSSVTF
jgi:hypothetical protein